MNRIWLQVSISWPGFAAYFAGLNTPLMKSTFSTLNLLKCLALGALLFTLPACEKDVEDDDTETAGGGGSGSGGSGSYWSRNDGQRTAYISFEGSVAKTCVGGAVTTGTYNASEPSMTFVISGNTIKFPLKFSGGKLIVGVPDQAINTNNATEYVKSNDFPCSGGGSGSGTGSGSGSGSSAPKKGTFKIRVYKPTGDCASSNTWGNGSAFNGTLTAEGIGSQGQQTWQTWFSTYGPSNNSTNTYWDYTSGTSATKLHWDLGPNRSSWPTKCSQKGTASIDFDGQVKQITITFQ